MLNSMKYDGQQLSQNKQYSSISLDHAKCKQFTDLTVRTRSFRNCRFCGDIEEATKAGFYHTGTADILQCFYCGLKLKNWDKQDSPWVEHARHGNNCPYLINVKGQEYIRRINQLSNEDIDADSPQHSPRIQYTDDLIFTTAAKALLKLQYNTRDILTAMKIYVKKHGNVEFTAFELATIIQTELGVHISSPN